MKKGSIIFVPTTIDFGGAEIVMLNMINQLKEDYQINVIYLKWEGTLKARFQEMGFEPIRFFQRNPITFIRNLLKIVRLLRQQNHQIIQGWMYHGNLLALFFKLFNMSNKVYWSIHHSSHGFKKHLLFNNLKIKMISLFSRFPEKIIYVSEFIQKEHEQLNFRKEKSLCIYNGIDTQHFRKDNESRSNIRNAYQIPEQSIVIGAVGRNHPLKDYNTFFKAVSMLLMTHHHVHFLIVGRDLSLASFIHFFDKVPKHLLANIHFTGEQNNVPELINAMDYFTSTSISESFGLVLLEALSCQKLCVSTDVVFYLDQFTDSVKKIKVKDCHGLVEKWQELFKYEEDEILRISREAREKVEQLFSLNTMTNNYIRIWESK